MAPGAASHSRRSPRSRSGSGPAALRSTGPWHPALQRGKSAGRREASGLTLAVFLHRGRAVEAQTWARWAETKASGFRRRRPEGEGPEAEATGPNRTPRWVQGSQADLEGLQPAPSSKAVSPWPGCSGTAGRQPVIWPLGQSGALSEA